MLYNNQCKYTSALLVPNGEALVRWVKANKIDLTDPGGIDAVLNELASVIDQYRQKGIYAGLFPSRWLPSAISIIDEPFSMDNGLVNTTGKMVRSKIIDHYKQKIDYLYTPGAKNISNPENIAAIKKLLKVG
jgi:long-chain acyl-CoA synthetase